MSYANVGKFWDRARFVAYLASLPRPAWCQGITFHHTSEPNLAMRPHGWSEQLMRNVADGYKNDRGWNRGPHFFPDDFFVWGLTPPGEQGIHAVSFNRTHLGIEVLGDYDGHDNPFSGRGAQSWANAFWVGAEVLRWLGLGVNADTIKFHRQDPKTNKTCPGTSIKMEWVTANVKSALNAPGPFSAPSAERVGIARWLENQGLKFGITRSPDGHVLVNGMWIESATYDEPSETTTALRAELEADLLKVVPA